HIGGLDRFEYTVIGDAVNEAARLTELAKETPGRVLTNASTLKNANETEQARWTFMKSIELRGRRRMTQLARPIRATLADRAELLLLVLAAWQTLTTDPHDLPPLRPPRLRRPHQ